MADEKKFELKYVADGYGAIIIKEGSSDVNDIEMTFNPHEVLFVGHVLSYATFLGGVIVNYDAKTKTFSS